VKLVLDTNVLLAGFGTRGLCAGLIPVCLSKHQLVLSEYILDEFRRHLIGKFRATQAQADEILLLLRRHAALVVPADISSDHCRDPDDLAVLGTAIAGHADLLVTGDGDLLTIITFQGIPIVTPRRCYELLK
jgi:uncharacterized protein